MKKPDWKKVGDYDYTKSLDAVGWAWEFLRRNQKYRKDYQAFCSGEYEEYIYEPAKLPSETDQQWETRCIYKEDVYPVRIRPEQYLARKWGLQSSLCDPEKTAPELTEDKTPVKFDVDGHPIFIELWDHTDRIPVEEEPGGPTLIRRDRLLVMFDLTRPKKAQYDELCKRWAHAKKIAVKSGFDVEGNSPKEKKFLDGIRALDALGQDVIPHVIGEALFVDDIEDIDVKAFDCIKSAKRNRDYAYKTIARRTTPISMT